MSLFEELEQRYSSGSVPWDSPSPPPEVIDQVDKMEPGLGLDLGCGYGRASIHLAQQGWQMDGVDFVPQAISEAISRADSAGVTERTSFHIASVTDLSFLDGPYDFALDVGCLHALSDEEMLCYRDGLCRLLKPGAHFLLFARLSLPETDAINDSPGLEEATIRAVFNQGFDLQKVEHGQTQVEDVASWESAWFWYRRSEH